MTRLYRFVLVLGFLVSAMPSGTANAVTPVGCTDGAQGSGALYRICLPTATPWNGDLVLFAHGYIAFNEPLAIPDQQFELPDGTMISVSDLVTALGFGYATSSYSVNGLAVTQGIDDLLDLVEIFKTTEGVPGRTFLVGGSEGGIITALSVEKHPDIYTAGLAACGPIGNFPEQINYFGNFRVVFDFFFPGVIPGSPTDIPQEVIDNWDAVYVPAIQAAIQARPLAIAQLLNVTGAPIGLNPATVEQTVIGVLWYSAFATNDATAKLGGQPFNNAARVYRGSFADNLLNLVVPRFAADPLAVAEMADNYTTSGVLIRPLVAMHTTGDPIMRFWNLPIYTLKVLANGSQANYVQFPPVRRYGHCSFTAVEILVAFGIMVSKTTPVPVELSGFERALPDANSRAAFRQALGAYRKQNP